MDANQPFDDAVAKAMARIRSLSDGDGGVLDVIACGSRSVPALRELLFTIDQSGIPDARIRALEALRALGAQETSIDFLLSSHAIADPVARLGEDAVVGAAARMVDNPADDRIFPYLVDMTRARPLVGIIAALGRSKRLEAIPALVRALAEDETRQEAENALLNFGVAAKPELLLVTAEPQSAGEKETESQVRQRRSALRLLDLLDQSSGRD